MSGTSPRPRRADGHEDLKQLRLPSKPTRIWANIRCSLKSELWLASSDTYLAYPGPPPSRPLAVVFAHVAARATLLAEEGVFANLGRKATTCANVSELKPRQ